MTRVCCFCERWESGGIESFLCNVLTHMDFTDLEVDIVTASIGESVFTKPLQNHGVKFFVLSGKQQNLLENHGRFRSLLRERRYDVFYLNAFQGMSLSYLKLASEAGISVRIAHSHNTALRKSTTRPLKLAIHKWARNRYSRYATDLLACSKDAAKFLFSKNELCQCDFRFIPNGIDTKRFCFNPEIRAKVRSELGVESAFVIGNIGRLCYQKNQSFLLDVLSKALKQNSNIVLILVGKGEDKVALAKRAKDLGISEKVIFCGATNHPEHLLWAMDAFAFPSLFEGFGIVAIEALAAGLPVVCSENVPREAHISSSLCVVPLREGPASWATTLLAKRGCRDSGQNDLVKESGFDIMDTARMLTEYFTKKVNL